jgi:hypothetical protein
MIIFFIPWAMLDREVFIRFEMYSVQLSPFTQAVAA